MKKNNTGLIIGIIMVLLLVALVVIGFFVKYTKEENSKEIIKIQVGSNLYYYDLEDYNDVTYYKGYFYFIKEKQQDALFDKEINIQKIKEENEQIEIIDEVIINNQIDSYDARFDNNLIRSKCDTCDGDNYYNLKGKQINNNEVEKEKEEVYVDDPGYVDRLNKMTGQSNLRFIIEKNNKGYVYYEDEKRLYVISD